MADACLSFPPPVDATPITGEQTCARLEEFRQMPWLEPDWEDATRDAVQVVERYCSRINVDYRNALLCEEPAMYMNFIDWMRTTSKRKKKQTYDMYWRRLCIYFSLLAEREMSNNVMKQMRRYINTRLRADGDISVRHKPKHTMSAEDLGILLRQLWLYTALTPLGRLLLQQGFVLLASSFTGTRPRILVPPSSIATQPGNTAQRVAETEGKASRNRKRVDGFQSDIPRHIRYDDLPRTLCYGDIDLFVIRNPDSGSDVIVAVIDFRNLKGTEQGSEGTKFMMHCDYQLAYCPITYILALAHADRAFKNERLTPAYILRLRVPPRLHTLPVLWKDEMLRIPILRHVEQTPYGVQVHPEKPMKYETSNSLLKQLGKDAGYDINIDHYAFRRWTANEANRAFTDQERNRILGHSGTSIFEKYYNDHFIHRDVQSVVLLRPPQAQLLRTVAQMNRNRDPKAPKDLTDEQCQILCRDRYLVDLRQRREVLRREICFGGKALSHARGTEMHRQHEELGKVISRRRQDLRRMGWDQVKKAYHSGMPVVEIDKQIDAMQGVELDDVALPELENDWVPPTPTFSCQEHERVADAFFGPTAETLMGAEALSRRIQVVNDLAVLCELREPPKRGPKLGWSKYDKPIDLDKAEASTAEDIDNTKVENTPEIPNLSFPTDQCMFCAGDASLRAFHPRSKQRPDSLRRHLENQHLCRLTEQVECPHHVCKEQGVAPFPNREVWLNHAAVVHKYDLNVKLSRLSSR